MSAHRWSGWPGAWCLDCGAEDANEVCLADHDVLVLSTSCPLHVNAPCPEPGGGRHDPYLRGARLLLLDLLIERRRSELLRLTDEWHDNPTYPGPLCEYLSMTPEQYAAWVEGAG